MKYVSMFQASPPMAAVWDNLRRASPGELQRHGVQHSPAIRHADLRHHQHRLLQVEDEPRARVHHVPSILCLRWSQPGSRVRLPPLSERIDWSSHLLVF